MQPWLEVVLVGLFVSVFSRVAHMLLVKREEEKTLTDTIKSLRQKLKGLKPADTEYTKTADELMNLQLKLNKMSLKPSIITLIPLTLLLIWMKNRYVDTGAFVILPFSLPIINNDIGWLLTYFLSTMIFSTIIKKVENLWRKRK